jgi:hypothetical protein
VPGSASNPAEDVVGAASELPLPASRARQRCPDELIPSNADLTLSLGLRDARSERRQLLPMALINQFSSAGGLEPRSATARYHAELVVEGFTSPHHFRRLNALHSEWDAGRLEGRLVVFDSSDRQALCQTPLHVRGDASGASLSRRLREATRTALEKKLYVLAQREASAALSGISRSFQFPSLAAELRLSAGEPE